MSLARQGLIILAVAVAVLTLWLLYVPAARPHLERVGLLQPLVSAGLVAADAAVPAPPASPPARVIVRPPEERRVNDIATAIGTGQAIRSVTIAPEVEGRVAILGAASGDRVAAGALLVELDSEAARIAVAQAELVLADAQEDLARAERLSGTGAVADLARQEAALAVRSAELGLRQARFVLSQHRLVAPMAGWVGILSVEAGDRVAAGDEITRLDDRSSLLVDFRVPERLVAQLRPGDRVEAAALAAEDRPIEGVVHAIDNRVDPASRTLLVQAAVPNPDDRLRAGMAFSIRIRLEGEPRPAVDPLAIQWGSEGAFVWVVRQGRAERVPVRILQRNADAVLIQAALRPDDLVVVEGVQTLRSGMAVEAVDETGSLAAASPATRG